LISPLDEKKETATASTAFLSRIVGQAKRTVKQIFEKPSLYALQFDRLAVLIAVSEGMLTTKQIHRLQEKAKSTEVRVVATHPDDYLIIKQAFERHRKYNLPALTKDGVLQLLLWARQVRDRALLSGQPLQESLALDDLEEFWQPSARQQQASIRIGVEDKRVVSHRRLHDADFTGEIVNIRSPHLNEQELCQIFSEGRSIDEAYAMSVPRQPTPQPTRPPQKQAGSNISGVKELAHGHWGNRYY
jgi:hypothetical protein